MPCTEFFTQEFSNLALKDSRLVRRAVSIGNALLSSPGSCIQEVIMLCDREADFFEFLTDLHGSSCKFVIRSKYDRPTGLSGRNHRTKFSELFSRAPYL